MVEKNIYYNFSGIKTSASSLIEHLSKSADTLKDIDPIEKSLKSIITAISNNLSKNTSSENAVDRLLANISAKREKHICIITKLSQFNFCIVEHLLKINIHLESERRIKIINYPGNVTSELMKIVHDVIPFMEEGGILFIINSPHIHRYFAEIYNNYVIEQSQKTVGYICFGDRKESVRISNSLKIVVFQDITSDMNSLLQRFQKFYVSHTDFLKQYSLSSKNKKISPALR